MAWACMASTQGEILAQAAHAIVCLLDDTTGTAFCQYLYIT